MGKSYKNTGDRPISIAVQGRGTMVTVGPGESYETESQAEEESFEANPDVEESGAAEKRERREKREADKEQK